MALADEIKAARKKVVTDGYEMSLGEIISLYKSEELVIDPVFQRLFRWDDERKTRFIESLILGIPIPPIFVYQDANGIWELIDGLQRLSTVLQLTGDLDGPAAEALGPLVLNGTRFLPSLNGKRWTESAPRAGDGLGQPLQIEIKRARIRVEILKAESDASAKYELFQRLNTGGAELTEQEVRNSIAVALNREFYDWLVERSNNDTFIRTTAQTSTALESQMGVELVLRFLAFRNIEYTPGLDVHEYLDDALFRLANAPDLDLETERETFDKTFGYLDEALEGDAFKRWNGEKFTGKFLMSLFEVISVGVAKNINALEKLTPLRRKNAIKRAAKNLWGNEIFTENSGAGVRGTTRLSRLLPIAAEAMKP
ncbi:TPA: DUF262 domain-containing protein [Burkholderia cenocepacia]|uniref:DUF262 domain-containing protein n=1 Tax=Burkholderia cenocepacia TaxID=95486 RepID=UPI001B8EECCD|nr:DUF262 domain-containing protein [Burkholderia cenocepacia]MBR7988280.1 DUF262 domain-containing protein [Burkholderia cenocepacia]MBR8071594.1 DUF262 domain-containing protein [Burkholderia cenocepacia]MBR8447615.1 DUF262 domain-containing protein [Burkholderia cenocepacia]HDR9803660.1 DUF262 domain-containing protein [Burkholderia cenocepacia]HDR9811914.1 DUF262 domain-containing protein [Burkholderia cenocepacia]